MGSMKHDVWAKNNCLVYFTHANIAGTKGYEQSSFSQLYDFKNKEQLDTKKKNQTIMYPSYTPMCIFGFLGASAKQWYVSLVHC
ncbi:hypothetical protein BpHYR1_034300 [Brachionus plicatilis]|uniref:Uncharacterized protein n=1 Tax=Brachionus plicatilis TaxID=10195 RepID=A0A3M7RUQ7_BRAPC|nr:hypothetical protein BpHYR1_034300 [Brachionus plicatilis]